MRILLGVTGSIAAYKAVEVLRRLMDLEAEVRVVMTEHAARFVAPLTFEALSGRPVLLDEFREREWSAIGHIAVTEGVDCALVVPATGNVIGKAAAGIADDTLTSVLLALACPLIMAPAMNDRMYRHPAVQRNREILRDRGVHFVDPETGSLACGAKGCGRLASPERIVQEVLSVLGPKNLAGTNILVTAGPTREPIDAVRFVSNASSGKMGYAVARAAHQRGARVVLVTGPVAISPPGGVEVVPVMTAAEMHQAVMERSGRSDVVIMAAAVSDFRPREPSERKIKKQDAPDMVRLERTKDILEDLGKNSPGPILIGFAAETDSLVENARIKLKQKDLDLIVANNVHGQGAGFGHDTNVVTMISRSGEVTELPLMSKDSIAKIIVDRIAELLGKQGISS